MILISKSEKDLLRSVRTGALGSVLLSVAACGPSDSDFAEFDTFRSPDQKHRVVVETAPKNSMAFASEVIRLYLVGQDTNERYLLTTTTLANDGSGLIDENIQAEWVDSRTVRLCLSGAEQEDEAIVIDVETRLFSVESATCAD